MNKEPIKIFEKQSGLIRLLIYLLDHQPINIQSIIDNTDIYPNIMYSSLNKSKDLGLIDSKIDKSSYPPKNMISLTVKGEKVARKLKEIKEILEGD
ncbi:MAG: hypothetical protein ACP5FQ_07040 [Thermoplasmata archaeon]